MKVAVIGGGMGGLCCSWLLSRGGAEVHLFERQAAPGLSSHAIDVAFEDDETRVVDVPPRVFTKGYYSELLCLYEYLGVRFETTDASTSYQVLGESTFFRFFNIIVGSWSVPCALGLGVFSLDFFRCVRDLIAFKRCARRDLNAGLLDKITLGEYLIQNNYSEVFSKRFLVPMFAVICTCSCESVEAYPANVIVEFMLSLALRPRSGVRRAVDGMRTVSRQLSASVAHTLCHTRVVRLRRHADDHRIFVTTVQDEEGSTAEETTTAFDHVVFATQANQALELLRECGESGPRAADRARALAHFAYEASDVTVHRDAALMPRRRCDWAPMNIFVTPDSAQAMCTAWQNRVQPLPTRTPLFQTWNPVLKPDPATIVSQAHFERPIVRLDTAAGLALLRDVQGADNYWFVGSYSLHGVPLLENACRSGLWVAEKLTPARRPWTRLDNEELGSHETMPPTHPRSISWLARVAVVAAVAALSAFIVAKRK